MLYPILLAVSLAVGIAGDVYDVIMTEKGLKAGVAAEGISMALFHCRNQAQRYRYVLPRFHCACVVCGTYRSVCYGVP